MFRLDGKVALITGAASGIGAATAEMFARAGADVACAWYEGDPHDVNATVEKVQAQGRRAVAIEGDVSKTADTERFVAETIMRLGRIDIVLANAAITRDVAAVELDDARMLRLLEIDLMGVFRTFRAALPALTAQKSGRLLATSSIAGAVWRLPWNSRLSFETKSAEPSASNSAPLGQRSRSLQSREAVTGVILTYPVRNV